VALPELQFSYSQFFVFDSAVPTVGCHWTERHFRQGFARRDGTVSVRTLLEFGVADVAVTVGAPSSVEAYGRVLAVPLLIRSASLSIRGPEEQRGMRDIAIPNGHYRVTIAQTAVGETREDVHIWVEKSDVPIARSQLLVVDEELDPVWPLLETANEP
jgi:competence protein J (ComJ)